MRTHLIVRRCSMPSSPPLGLLRIELVRKYEINYNGVVYFIILHTTFPMLSEIARLYCISNQRSIEIKRAKIRDAIEEFGTSIAYLDDSYERIDRAKYPFQQVFIAPIRSYESPNYNCRRKNH